MERKPSRSYRGDEETLAEYEQRVQDEEDAWEEYLWSKELENEDR